MEAVCIRSEEIACVKGFEIKLGIPATIDTALRHTPASLLMRGARVPTERMSDGERVSTIHSQREVAHLFSKSVLLAHRQKWGGDQIARMMAASSESERLAYFEDLAEVICSSLATQAEKSAQSAYLELSEILVSLGGTALCDDFKEVYARYTSLLDFSFGLVNDRDGSEFGNGSDKFQFRLFTDLDFDVSPSKVTNSYLAAMQGVLIDALPSLGFTSHADFMEYFLGWVGDDFDIGLPPDVKSADIAKMQDWLTENVESMAGIEEPADIIVECPMFLEKLAELCGSLEAAKAGLASVVNTVDNFGMDLVDWLVECFDCQFCIAQAAEIKSLQEEILGRGVEDSLASIDEHADETLLSAFLYAARHLIERELAMASRAKAAFSYVDESDAPIDFRLPFETNFLPDRSYFDRAYQDHYEMCMNGDVSTASVCVVMGDDTVLAIEAWHRCIALMAAIHTAGNWTSGV